MGSRLAALFALLFLPGFAFALSCNQSIHTDMLVPAVNDAGYGQIVPLQLEVKPGDGTTYIATAPIVGGMTQVSGQTAMQLATELTGYDRSTCDVLFKIGNGELTSIDGPSAGAAMALLIMSALKNETLKNDFTITGTIEPNGAMGLVGGIPEKAQAAASSGLGLFIVPYLGVDDRITLDALGKKVNIAVVQVGDIRQAEDLAIGKSKNFSNPKLAPEPTPSVEQTERLNGQKFLLFKSIAGELLAAGKETVYSISQDKSEFSNYFISQLAVAQNAIEKGYYYTGANTAFLASINAEFLSSAGSSKEGIVAKVRKVEECYAHSVGAKATEDNWEWVIGGQLRASWAKKKTSDIDNSSFDTDVKTLETLKDVIYAEKWCAASESLLNAQGGGKEVDQSAFKTMAAKAIRDAEDYIAGRTVEFSDQSWHLEVAKQEFSDKLYGAAVYDATYALYMSKGYDDFPNLENASAVLSEAKGRQYQGIWASLYSSQADYFQAKGEPGRVSFQLIEFSEGLENKTLEMQNALAEGPQGPENKTLAEDGGLPSTEKSTYIFLALAVFALLLITAIFLAKKALEK